MLKLVSPQDNFDSPEHELYAKVRALVYDKIDGITPLGAVGVLEYIAHEVMHEALEYAE